jgi:hypothetical protein
MIRRSEPTGRLMPPPSQQNALPDQERAMPLKFNTVQVFYNDKTYDFHRFPEATKVATIQKPTLYTLNSSGHGQSGTVLKKVDLLGWLFDTHLFPLAELNAQEAYEAAKDDQYKFKMLTDAQLASTPASAHDFNLI